MAAGFNVEEAVKSATSNGAKLMGIKDIGIVAKGMTANIIAAPGPPSRLPESLSSVQYI